MLCPVQIRTSTIRCLGPRLVSNPPRCKSVRFSFVAMYLAYHFVLSARSLSCFCCAFVSFLASRPTPAAAPVVQELSPYEEYMASRRDQKTSIAYISYMDRCRIRLAGRLVSSLCSPSTFGAIAPRQVPLSSSRPCLVSGLAPCCLCLARRGLPIVALCVPVAEVGIDVTAVYRKPWRGACVLASRAWALYHETSLLAKGLRYRALRGAGLAKIGLGANLDMCIYRAAQNPQKAATFWRYVLSRPLGGVC